ncbi:hypothetical protein GALMADRAFT_454014 [Galerina marginata CBS 339.88]|uniref:Uncharacterized protein n=1 Tax=Galerina marginata (strain CBS 339.88) TaxID=685588 RepID=A0A067T0L5_GALM3|nr:hypothetical protein GALMADRAFT_454014 [Galerina marginata CBS 339.88]
MRRSYSWIGIGDGGGIVLEVAIGISISLFCLILVRIPVSTWRFRQFRSIPHHRHYLTGFAMRKYMRPFAYRWTSSETETHRLAFVVLPEAQQPRFIVRWRRRAITITSPISIFSIVPCTETLLY